MPARNYTIIGDGSFTIEGNVYTLTLPELPSGYSFTLNETTVEPGSTIQITANSVLGLQIPQVPAVTLTPTLDSMSEFKVDGVAVGSGQQITLAAGPHTVTAVGATSVPMVSVNGENVTKVSINGQDVEAANFPYNFQPVGGMTNNIFITGIGASQTLYPVTIAGTNIADATLNGAEITLPHTFTPTEASTIAVSGEIYQLDINGLGGAMISQEEGSNSIILSDGKNKYHQIIDITEDTYITVDGKHTILLTGTDVQSVTINGIQYTSLPQTIQNRAMTASIAIQGNPVTPVSITGRNLRGLTVNNQDQPITSDGNYSLTVSDQKPGDIVYVDAAGAQPRTYNTTWDTGGSVSVKINGNQMPDTTDVFSYAIGQDSMIDLQSEPLQIAFEINPGDVVYVNGRPYTDSNFTASITGDSNIQVSNNTCALTIDYGDDSYTINVPQSLVTLTAAHRDWWLFDGWSSNDVGISSPKSVKCLVNLQGMETAHLVCHYQRYPTENRPNPWN